MSEEQSKASVVVDTLDVEIPWYVHTCNQGTEVCRALTAAFPYAAKGHLVLVHVKEERVADRNEPQRHRYHHSEWRLYMFVDHDLRFVTDERAEWSSWQRVESHPYNHDNRYRAVPPPVLDRDELPDDDDGYFTRGDVALVRDGDDALVMYALDRGKWKPVNST